LKLDHEAAVVAIAGARLMGLTISGQPTPRGEVGVDDDDDCGYDDDEDDVDEDDVDEEDPGDAGGDDEDVDNLGDDGEGDDTVMPLRGQPDDDDEDDGVDEAVLAQVKPRQQRPEDEGEFDALLAATMAESLESRKLVNKVSADNMTIPFDLINKQTPSAPAPFRLGVPMDSAGSDGDKGVVFKLLRKKGRGGGRVEVRELVVPESASLARYSTKAAVRFRWRMRGCMCTLFLLVFVGSCQERSGRGEAPCPPVRTACG
jgi:hypothetical protein